MLLSSLTKWLKNWCHGPVSPVVPAEPDTCRTGRRKGATAMEYLVVSSLILVVLIIGVQSLASNTKGLFNSSGAATSKTVGAK